MICRYLFALQVKRDLSCGTLPCHEHTAILMASYIVQCLYHCSVTSVALYSTSNCMCTDCMLHGGRYQ